MNKKLTFKQMLLLITFGIVLYLGLKNISQVYKMFLYIIKIVTPLFYGGLVAVVLNVLMSALEGTLKKIKFFRKKEKLVCVISLVLTFLIVIGAIVAIFVLIIPEFAAAVPKIERSLSNHKDEINSFCNNFGIDVTNVDSFINSLNFDSLINEIKSNFSGIFTTVMGVATSITGGVFTTLITLVACIYILLSKKQLERQSKALLYAYVKENIADSVTNFFTNLSKTFKRFLSSQCIDSLILGILLLIAMKIFRLPYAEIISAMTVIFALIPYFGAFISCAVGAILISLDAPKSALIFIAIFLVIQQIEGNLIYPRIVGTSVGLPALWTLLAVYVGGELFGVVGMILFIPVVSVVYTTLSDDVEARMAKRKKEKAAKESAEEEPTK